MSDIKYIFLDDKKYQKKAEYFSNKYQVPISIKKPTNCHIALSSKPELCFKNEKFASDFTKGRFFTRLSKYQTELHLKKAIGWKSNVSKNILDCTGGLGHDAFILALLGQKITFVEKNKGLCILFENALSELPNEKYFNSARSKILIKNGDSKQFIIDSEKFDVIYIDPMFNSKKKLKRSKEMSFLDIYLDDYDSPLEDYLKTDHRRIVVKRELRSLAGNNRTPEISFKGKSIKYDVYT